MFFDILFYLFFLILLFKTFRINLNFVLNIFFSYVFFFCFFKLQYVSYINFIFFISFLWVLKILMNSDIFSNINISINFFLSVLIIFFGGLLLINSTNLVLLVFGFELIMLTSLNILKIFSKNERILEAFNEMFSLSLLGSFFLIVGLLLSVLTFNSNNILTILANLFFILGFSIKIPLWPFTSWLMKAHVEASTEFSIFLSGFLVKFGVLGLYKLNTFLNFIFFNNIVLFLAIMGIVDVCVKLFLQVDLKRIVALTTVFETNWLTLCFFLSNTCFLNIGYSLIFIHCLTTTLEFYLVEFIYRRYKTRNYLQICNLKLNYPILYNFYLLSVLIIIGFPGTVVFLLKFFFFSLLLSIDIMLSYFLAIFFFLILPIFFIRLFLIVENGNKSVIKLKKSDLNKNEILLFLIITFLLLIFSFFIFFII